MTAYRPGPRLRALLDRLGPATEAHIKKLAAEAPRVDQMSPERRAIIAAALNRGPLKTPAILPRDAA